ncbi:MAG: hypothetical protein KAQ99_06930 [Candidatus Aureabacteria bacterium]|nr:hypothetical protein [Candidatus Auribacterota bacterium]
MYRKTLFLLTACILIISGLIYAADAGDNQVIVYYFYGDFRCASCHKIEQYTKKSVEEFFKDALTSGELIFKPVNMDNGENRHFVDDYQLYTKSVILSLVKDGKEVKYKNLPKVWNYLGNKKQFYEYIRSEITRYLEEAS